MKNKMSTLPLWKKFCGRSWMIMLSRFRFLLLSCFHSLRSTVFVSFRSLNFGCKISRINPLLVLISSKLPAITYIIHKLLFLFYFASTQRKLTCQTRNACNWNGKQLQNFILSAAIENTHATYCRKTFSIITIKERIMMNEGLKTAQFIFIFDDNWPQALKVLWAPCQHCTNTFDWKCKFVGVARDPL